MATIQTRSNPNTNTDRADNRRRASLADVIPGPLRGAWWKWGTGLLMVYVIYGAFFIAKGVKNFVANGDSARIMFFHVPVAALSSLWYLVGMVYAVRVLMSARKRRLDLDTDAKSAACMELGFLYTLLATITGSIFANLMWNSYWNWDSRETSIAVMLLLYAAYLVLRGATSMQPEKRAKLSAVYSIVGVIPAIFLIWIVPRLHNSATMHPTDVLTNLDKTSVAYKLVLYPSFLAFTLLFVWLFQLRFRLYKATQSDSLENGMAQSTPLVGQ